VTIINDLFLNQQIDLKLSLQARAVGSMIHPSHGRKTIGDLQKASPNHIQT
jgi:hypothetical protein